MTREVGNSVSVISTATNSVIATVPVSGGAFGLAVSPDGSKVYVGVSGFHQNGNVSVIDAAKNTVTTTITVGIAPSGVAVTPDGKTVYVANLLSNTVSVIDTTANNVTTTIPGFNGPDGVAVTPGGKTVYVANTDSVSVIDTTSNTVTVTIPIAGVFEALAVTPDGTKVYVADVNGGVSVIDTGSNTRTTTIAVGNTPVGLAFTRDSTKAYVANEGDGTVSVIDTAANTVTTTIGGLNGAVAFGMFIGPVPQSIRFASFSAELSASSFFRLEGAFTLAAKSNGINPVKDNVILQIGTFSFQIPPGSFRQVQKGTFVFTGTIDQVSFQALIVRVAKNRFRYNFNGTGLSLTPFSKVTVGLTIGIDNGATLVTVSN